MDEADEIAPLVAMLDQRDRPLAVKAPDLVQNRLEANAVLIHGPQLDLRRGEARREISKSSKGPCGMWDAPDVGSS